MTIPLERGISHTEVYFGLLFHIIILHIFWYLHCSIEMFSTWIIIPFLSQDFSKLHISIALTFTVLKFIWKFKISLNKHLHFILVHLGINLIPTYFTKITNSNRLSSYTAHLDCITQSKLMVNWWFLVVSNLVVDNSQIDMCKEFPSHICNFFMFHVISNCIVIIYWFNVSFFHVVYSNTVVSQCLSMHISDSSADLKELLVLLDCIFELAKIVV